MRLSVIALVAALAACGPSPQYQYQQPVVVQQPAIVQQVPGAVIVQHDSSGNAFAAGMAGAMIGNALSNNNRYDSRPSVVERHSTTTIINQAPTASSTPAAPVRTGPPGFVAQQPIRPAPPPMQRPPGMVSQVARAPSPAPAPARSSPPGMARR